MPPRRGQQQARWTLRSGAIRVVLLVLGLSGLLCISFFSSSSSLFTPRHDGNDERLLTGHALSRKTTWPRLNKGNHQDKDGASKKSRTSEDPDQDAGGENSASGGESKDSPPSIRSVGIKTREVIWTQQFEWCIQSLDIHGFQMLDSSNCWSPARHMMVTHLNVTSLYSNVYHVALDPLTLMANQTIRVVGDSVSRFFVTALYYILLQDAKPDQTVVPSFHWNADEFHGTIHHVIPPPYNITLQWNWAPGAKEVRHFLESIETNELQYGADHNIIMIGNWYRTQTRQKWFRDAYKKLLVEIRTVFPYMQDLVLETPPRHPADHPNDTLQQEESFNSWWAKEISSHVNSSTHGNATPVPVVNGFYPFHVNDQSDGIHSVTHAMYSAFLHLWRWKWLKEYSTTTNGMFRDMIKTTRTAPGANG